MIPVTIEVKGERQLYAHLDALPAELEARLTPVIGKLTHDLLQRVHAAEPFRTGALRASTRSFLDKGPGFVRGKVRVLLSPTGSRRGKGLSIHNIAAAALEYGVHSRFEVAAHRMRLTHTFGRPSSNWVIVNAYYRRVNIKARRFLRDPFEQIRPQAIAEIQRALDQKL